MRSLTTWLALGWVTLVLASCAGCPQNGEPEPVEPVTPQTQVTQPEGVPTAVKPEKEPEPPPPPPTVPEVHMTEALRDTCVVFVGDPLPEAELADLAGVTKPLAALQGEKLTAVLFWTRGESMFAQMAATQVLQDLQKDVAEPYGEKGVSVVAINVNDEVEAARENVEEAAAAFANLSDPEGEYFAEVATEGLPRVYLLDAEGKIIWLDLEFSRTTRRNLLQAIQVELGEI